MKIMKGAMAAAIRKSSEALHYTGIHNIHKQSGQRQFIRRPRSEKWTPWNKFATVFLHDKWDDDERLADKRIKSMHWVSPEHDWMSTFAYRCMNWGIVWNYKHVSPLGFETMPRIYLLWRWEIAQEKMPAGRDVYAPWSWVRSRLSECCWSRWFYVRVWCWGESSKYCL